MSLAGFGKIEVELKKTMEVHTSKVEHIIFGLPDSKALLSVDASFETKVTRYDGKGRIPVFSHPGLPSGKFIKIVHGKYYITQHSESEMRLWSASANAPYISSLTCSGKFNSLTVSADGNLLVGICSDGSLMAWRPGNIDKKNDFIARRMPPAGEYIAAAINSKNTVFAATYGAIWRFDQNFQTAANLVHRISNDHIMSLDLSHDDSLVITTSQAIRAIDTNNRMRFVFPQVGSRSIAQNPLFSPNKNRFLVQYDTGEYELRSFDSSGIGANGESDKLIDYKWSPRGSFLYSVRGNKIEFYSVKDLKLITTYEDAAAITAVAFSLGEDLIALGYENGSIKMGRVSMDTPKPTSNEKTISPKVTTGSIRVLIENSSMKVITPGELLELIENNPGVSIRMVSNI